MSKFIFRKEHDEWIRKFVDKYEPSELFHHFKVKFECPSTYSVFRKYCRRNNIPLMNITTSYTQAEKEWMKENASKLHERELYEEFSKRFGKCHSIGSIKVVAQKVGGHKSKEALEERRMMRYSKIDNYQEQVLSRKNKEIVYVRVPKEYLDSIGRKGIINRWIPKKEYVWRMHYGDIPKGCCIITLDRDEFNCSIENLAMVSSHEILFLGNNNFLNGFPEVTKSAIKLYEYDKTIKGVLENV